MASLLGKKTKSNIKNTSTKKYTSKVHLLIKTVLSNWRAIFLNILKMLALFLFLLYREALYILEPQNYYEPKAHQAPQFREK